MELDDPLDWNIDQVIAALCNRNSPYLQISPSSVVPDLDALSGSLRDNLINGLTLLTTVDDNVLREDLGLKTLGHRAFLSRAIRTLRTKSIKFREQEHEMGTHTQVPGLQGGMSDTTRSPPILGFPPPFPSPVISHNSSLHEKYITPRRIPDSSTGQTTLRYNPASMPPPPEGINERLGQQPIGGPLNLGFQGWPGFSPLEFNKLKFGYAQGAPADRFGSGEFTSDDTYVRSPQSVHGDGWASPADRREGPNGDAGYEQRLSTDSLAEVKGVPIAISRGAVRSGHTWPPNLGSTPGKTVARRTERKRVAPTLVAQNPMASHGGRKLDALGRVAMWSSSDAFKSSQAHTRSQTTSVNLVEEITGTYLGAMKISVDDLFFGNVGIGQEMQDDGEDEDNFVIMPANRKPNGSRLYVNKIMRHYLFKPLQVTFSRDEKICCAVAPYSAKVLQMLSGRRIQSYMLFSTLGQVIRITRENAFYWPEVSADGTFIDHGAGDSGSALQNPFALPKEGNENHEWDFLLKWEHMGSDIIPAQLGESGSEGEYDLDTWNEIEQEHGPLSGSLENGGKRTLMEDEVNQAIDDGIKELVAKWELEKLPKRKQKAWSIWRKSRRNGTKRIQIREAQHRIDQINEARLGRMRKEILTEIWKKTAAVRKQCRIMEQSIFDREDLKWTISLLERKREPRRPPARTVKEKKPKVTNQLCSDEDGDVEILGSGTDGFESGLDADVLGDFVIDDGDNALLNTDTEMADVEDIGADSPDERMTPRLRETNSVGTSFENPIRGIDDESDNDGSGDDCLRNGVPMHIGNTTPTPIAAASSSPLSPAKTLTTPNPTRPSTPTEGGWDRTPEVPARNDSSAFIDLTLSDSAEMPPNPFRSGGKIQDHPQKISGSATKGSKAAGRKRGIIDLASSPDGNPLYEALKGMSIETFENSGDKRSVIVHIVGNLMDYGKRRSLSLRLLNRTRDELVEDRNKGLQAVATDRINEMTAPGGDGIVVMRLTFLYLSWIQAKQCNITQQPPPKALELAKSVVEFFRFRGFLREVLRGWEPDLFRHVPINYDTDRWDGPGLQPLKKAKRNGAPIQGRFPIAAHAYRNNAKELENPSSHRKRKRAVMENENAKRMREMDQQRLQEQEKRRIQLEARLQEQGTTSAGNPSRIVINTGKHEHQELIYINQHVGGRIQKHQIEGVQFMWREIVTDGESSGGCLLAHSMGLGKTMQVITLLVTIAEVARSKDPKISSQIPHGLRQSRSLILCPPGLIDNWWEELQRWAPSCLFEEIIGKVRRIDSSVSDPNRRYSEIGAWFKRGGILIMSYHIFRNFVLNKTTRASVLTPRNLENLKHRLLNGPNIIVADEAHILKNASAKISVATTQLRSRSRIALTGSPLANNLEEYHSMIDWTAPGYLGPLIEFRAKYVEPIQEGLYFDSLELERRRSLKMLQVLKRDLEPKVHRADISVLKGSLPPKIEFVIRVPLTKVQKGAYKRYVQSMPFGNNGDVGNASLWDWLVILSLLCNHPLCFKEKLLERDRKEPQQGIPTPINAGTPDEDQVEDGQVEVMPGDMPVADIGITEAVIKQQIAILDQVGSDLDSVVHSHKAMIFVEILDASIESGDKVLVFSHSLQTLNYLEGLLKKDSRRYSRLDGSTKMSDRQQATKDFNHSGTDVYLISTRAGGLGLNLYGANRVIIFDFKFNPTWEEQAVGRAYRIGQKKPVFVYHFISAGTFEEVVHNKAVFKMQLASRVVDKKNPTRYAMKTARDYLFEPKEVALKDLSDLKGKDPEVLDKVLDVHNGQAYFFPFHRVNYILIDIRDGCVSSIELTETFQRDDNDKLTAEEEREADQLLKDERLKRSNPEAYLKMLSERQRVASAKALIRKAVPPPSSHGTLPKPSTPVGISPSLRLKKTPLEPANTPSSRRAQAATQLAPPAEGTTGGGVVDEQAPNQEVSPFISAALEHEKKRREGQ
ncbi:MAG: hypothetical protein M1840_008553 [Geoglossum simile]|nr:MAG: hypothetical protein M1840_008553 [Geoglossum simile]